MKRIISFDSSTLILLAKTSLLREISANVKCVITCIVRDECTRKDTYDSKIIKELLKEKLLEVADIKHNETEKIANDFGIQDGEASALLLAVKEKCMLATDDRLALKACNILNTEASTAIHFVVRAYKRKLIDKKSALEKTLILEKYGRYSSRIIEDAKKRIEGD